MSVDGIKAMGNHLLDVLLEEQAVPYSRFYNHRAGTDTLLAAAGMKYLQPQVESDDVEGNSVEEQLIEEGHVMLEYAAHQLEDLGVVRIVPLTNELVDGEPDFCIELVANDASVISAARQFGYRFPGSGIYANAASEWLVALLDGGGEGQELTLNEVMEFADSECDLSVTDGCKNEYHLGSLSFAWAFEVSLWHHVRANHVEPCFKTDAQKEIWDDFFRQNGKYLPDMPEVAKGKPLWTVPFRLTSGLDLAKVKYVGWIGRE